MGFHSETAGKKESCAADTQQKLASGELAQLGTVEASMKVLAAMNGGKQLDLSADVVVAELCYFIRQNCLWSTDEFVADMDRALSVLVEHGSPEEVVDSLLDFSPYAKRPAVLRALRLSAAKRDDAQAFQSAFSKFEQ